MAIACSLECSNQLDIIYRGSTPIFNFNVCLDTGLVDLANTHIVFTSGEGLVDKSGADITLGEGTMSCALTQDDTMSFTASQVNIQILVTMQSGQKPVSIIETRPVASTLRGDNKW